MIKEKITVKMEEDHKVKDKTKVKIRVKDKVKIKAKAKGRVKDKDKVKVKVKVKDKVKAKAKARDKDKERDRQEVRLEIKQKEKVLMKLNNKFEHSQTKLEQILKFFLKDVKMVSSHSMENVFNALKDLRGMVQTVLQKIQLKIILLLVLQIDKQ